MRSVGKRCTRGIEPACVNVLLLLHLVQQLQATGHSATWALRILIAACGISKIAYLSSFGKHRGVICRPVRQLLE